MDKAWRITFNALDYSIVTHVLSMCMLLGVLSTLKPSGFYLIIHLFIILKSIQLFSFHTSSLFIFKVQDTYLNYVLGVCYLYSDITH